jgi:abortive infection bacteriophage resistance protein
MTFGVFSRLFALTGPAKIKKRVAGEYQIGLPVLESLLHHLVYLRNLCAHHSRLWNRKFTITLQLPMSYPPALVGSPEPVRGSPPLQFACSFGVLCGHN